MPETSPLTVGDLFKKAFAIKTAQLLYVLLLVATFLIGYLIARVQFLEKNQNTSTGSQTQTGAPAPPEKVDVKE